jgi:hypothetical protein
MSKKNKTPKSIGDKYKFNEPPKFDRGDILRYYVQDTEDTTFGEDHHILILDIKEYSLNAGAGSEKMYQYLCYWLDEGYYIEYNTWYLDCHFEKVA